MSVSTPLDTPIVFVFFNRPECAAKAFERIREVRPTRLFLIADGPRTDMPSDSVLCARTRAAIEALIDWPCEVTKDYAVRNMGCGKRLPSGLTKAFQHVDRAIILEDDIVPHISFFDFCDAMLEQYKDESSVVQVCGYNRFNYRTDRLWTYFFSRYSDIWGWATWRRAWAAFDKTDADAWNRIRNRKSLRAWCLSEREAQMREYTLTQIYEGKLDAWAMRWELAKLRHAGLAVVPSVNLTSNVGFGVGASHTLNPLNRNRFTRVRGIERPYIGPEAIKSERAFDLRYERRMFSRRVVVERLRSLLLRCLRGM